LEVIEMGWFIQSFNRGVSIRRAVASDEWRVASVRVLEVTVPAKGGTVPMHHHRWPSFFLSWDTGGATPHIRYHRPDGSVRDIPSKEYPVHAGRWDVRWMIPESMHEIEVVDKPKSDMPADSPTDLRIEIKCHP
jgi:hypothetical protein